MNAEIPAEKKQEEEMCKRLEAPLPGGGGGGTRGVRQYGDVPL